MQLRLAEACAHLDGEEGDAGGEPGDQRRHDIEEEAQLGLDPERTEHDKEREGGGESGEGKQPLPASGEHEHRHGCKTR